MSHEPNACEESLFKLASEWRNLDCLDLAIKNRSGVLDHLHGMEWIVKASRYKVHLERPLHNLLSKYFRPRVNFIWHIHYSNGWPEDGCIELRYVPKNRHIVGINVNDAKYRLFRLGRLLKKIKKKLPKYKLICSLLIRKLEIREIKRTYRAKVFTDPVSILSSATNRPWTSCLDLKNSTHPQYKTLLADYIFLGSAVVFFYLEGSTRPCARDLWVPGTYNGEKILVKSARELLEGSPATEQATYTFVKGKDVSSPVYPKEKFGIPSLPHVRHLMGEWTKSEPEFPFILFRESGYDINSPYLDDWRKVWC